MASVDNMPKYVTAVSKSDVADGWRDNRSDGGIVIDIETDEVVCAGLSMPHSPRVHNGKLWILEAGTGHFGYVDLSTGTFQIIAFCPGFLRGMTFIGDYALVGISSVRKNHTFTGLKLDKNLKEKNTEPHCGIQVINLNTGNTEHWIRMEGIVDELYDVVVLPETTKPLIIGTKKEEIKKMISIEE